MLAPWIIPIVMYQGPYIATRQTLRLQRADKRSDRSPRTVQLAGQVPEHLSIPTLTYVWNRTIDQPNAKKGFGCLPGQ